LIVYILDAAVSSADVSNTLQSAKRKQVATGRDLLEAIKYV